MAIKYWCHASCCSGETELTDLPASVIHAHDAQLFLDQNGLPSGSLGEQHEAVVRAMVQFREAPNGKS